MRRPQVRTGAQADSTPNLGFGESVLVAGSAIGKRHAQVPWRGAFVGAPVWGEASDEARSTHLSALVKKKLPHELGGNWQGPALTAFWSELYDRRNSAVHAGVVPLGSEVLAAVDAFDELEAFLEKRLLSKWKLFPRTLMCLMGEDLRGDDLASHPDFQALQDAVFADGRYYWPAPDRRAKIDGWLRNRVRFP